MSPLSAQALLSITKSPGAQYLLLDAEKTLHELNTGYSEVIAQQPVTADTTFNAYSITKTFTSAAIFKLIEEEKLSLDEVVNPLLPQFSFSDNFTLRHLLSHQSGISNPLPLKWIHLAGEAFDEPAFTNELISQNLKLTFKPGSKMSYTNLGYIVLGKLIQEVTKTDYKSFIREQVLMPSVKSGYVSFDIPDSGHATGYHPTYSFTNLLLTFLIDRGKYMQSAGGGWSAFRYILLNGTPYGGLIANATGLAEYLRAFLRKEILTEPSLAQLFTVQRDKMCLGWYKGQLGKLDYFCHAGGGGGYYCEIRLYPQIRKASVLMTNRSGFTDQRKLDHIDKHFIQ